MPLNLVISETSPLGGMIFYTYDSVGNLAYNTDALSNKTTYTYDANVTTQAFGYDLAGKVITPTHEEGEEPNGDA